MFRPVSSENRRRAPGHSLRVAAAIVLLPWAAVSARAQAAVDQRVDLSVNQTGRLLDRNPQVSGSGVNYVRPMSPLMVGNTTASGLASQGMSLRSVSPIADPTAFRATLGSSALYTFRRDSVNVTNLAAPFGQPYYDPSSTVPTAGFLQGLTTPGNTPVRADNPLDLRLQSRSALPASAGVLVPGVTPIAPPWSPTPSAAIRSSIFGVEPPPRLALPTNLPRPWERTQPEPVEVGSPLGAQARLDAGARAPRAPAPTDAAARPLSAALRADLYPPVGPDGPAARAASPALPGMLVAAPPEARAEPPAGQLLAPQITDVSILPGYDVLTDLQLALALQADPAAPWFVEMQKAIAQRPEVARHIAQNTMRDAAEFLNKMLNTPLETLTGAGSSELNDQLLKAESLMEIGHYAEAADRYDVAHRMAPANPLPLIGKGHALLASGSYNSAAGALLAGIELADRYPGLAPLLLKRLDLTPLMGGGEIVDIRRADLMRQLERSDNADLRFLLGYLEYHTGDRTHGLQNLKRAADNPRAGAVIARYPGLVGPAESPPAIPPPE